MSISKNISVSFLFFSVSLHLAICADPLYHSCFSGENYTANNPYAANLNGLIKLLAIKAPPSGFGLGSRGRAQGKVNGLALCRGDVSSSNCKTCVIEAGKELHNYCPRNKGAIIWYDNCFLKYSNADFFGKIDNQNRFYMVNTQLVDNPAKFNLEVKELLAELSEEAYASPRFYYSGELRLGRPSSKLYGLAQCTRDLSGADCQKCLDAAIRAVSDYTGGRQGGRVVGGSCNVRYEIYPFVNA